MTPSVPFAERWKIEMIEQRYQVSNILSDGYWAKMRVIAKECPGGYEVENAMPTLEDVYLYHFG